MLIPIGTREGQELILVRKTGFAITQESVGGAVTFVPLLSRFAWADEHG